MALFKKECPICGADSIDKNLSTGGVNVCQSCYSKVYFTQEPFSLTPEKLAEHIAYREENQKLLNSFVPQGELDLSSSRVLYNDETHQFYYMNALQRRSFDEHGDFIYAPAPYLYSYDQIQGYDYFENDSVVSSRDGVGKAVGGAVLFGVAGAIVGNAMRKESTKSRITNMRVALMLDNPYQNVAEFVFKQGTGVIYGSSEYVTLKRQADSLIELFDHMTGKDSMNDGQLEGTGSSSGRLSPSDEILKLKSMLDQGILTEDEFSVMKQKLIEQM